MSYELDEAAGTGLERLTGRRDDFEVDAGGGVRRDGINFPS